MDFCNRLAVGTKCGMRQFAQAADWGRCLRKVRKFQDVNLALPEHSLACPHGNQQVPPITAELQMLDFLGHRFLYDELIERDIPNAERSPIRAIASASCCDEEFAIGTDF